MNHETLTKLIESTEHDYKSFKREFARLNTLVGAMQYGLNLIEAEYDEIQAEDETTYEPYNYGYMKCLKDEIADLEKRKANQWKWYKEEESKLEIFKAQLTAVA